MGSKSKLATNLGLKNRAWFHINQYAIPNNSVNLSKQTVLKSDKCLYNDKDVNTKSLKVHGFSEAIFKISTVENIEKPKLGFFYN